MEESNLKKSIFGISPSENISIKKINERSSIYEVSGVTRTTEEISKLLDDFVAESPDEASPEKNPQSASKMPTHSLSSLPGFSKKKTTTDNVDYSGLEKKKINERSSLYEVSGVMRTTEEIFKLLDDFVNCSPDKESPEKEPQSAFKMPKRLFSSGFSKKKTTTDNVADSGVCENVENLFLENSKVQNLMSEDVETTHTPLQLPKASLYFNVLFCKQSARKHKKWESDGILSINGTSAVLKNMEGKDIACGSGYKVKEVTMLEEGSQFFIGGKECEIQSSISEEDYASGKCFTEVCT